jgi:hypothetical protein
MSEIQQLGAEKPESVLPPQGNKKAGMGSCRLA